ncbi:MAG: GGDEF domain-containing protein, partial [Pseudomonadota bacterium]
RYGGEEFGVILPNIGERAALALAEQMKMAIEALAIPHATSAAADHVTVSAGLTVLHPGMDMTMSTLIERADRALYQAKEEARNTVRAAYK